MQIRHSTVSDIPAIMEIYSHARQQMKKNGNPHQWGDEWPPEDVVVTDIRSNISYVIVDHDEIVGVFVFIIGTEPTYAVIEDGKWLNDEPYGVIHRIAAGLDGKGIVIAALDFCFSQIGNIRIDTHSDNEIMQHILEKRGFERCGIITVGDGTPRIAYQMKMQIENLESKA